MSLHDRKTILFMTVAEAGQSNSIFTLALELLTYPNVDVHVASFPVLRKHAEELSSSARVVERKHPGSTFTFQEIYGMSCRETTESKGLNEASFPHPPLARTHEGLNTIMIALASWNGKVMTRLFWFTSPPIQIADGDDDCLSSNTSESLTVTKTSSSRLVLASLSWMRPSTRRVRRVGL